MSEDKMTKERAAAFIVWLESPEGKAAYEESKRQAMDTEALLEKGTDIPWWKLYEPFTI
jgi:hypothetical protein